MKRIILVIALLLVTSLAWGEESITIELTSEDMDSLQKGFYIHRWRENGKYMDEICPPQIDDMEIFTLPINKEILNSFERINTKGDKCWRTVCYIEFNNRQWFNSIWLTQKEYDSLKEKHYIKTKFREKPILIKIID